MDLGELAKDSARQQYAQRRGGAGIVVLLLALASAFLAGRACALDGEELAVPPEQARPRR
jgi:hypothetical protein